MFREHTSKNENRAETFGDSKTPKANSSSRNAGRLLGLASIVLASGVIGFAFSRPGVFACFWRNEDCDFCYAVAALRFANGTISSGLIEHPGYPLIQLLSWFYMILSRLGMLDGASYAALAADPDPLLRIKAYVTASWFLSALIYLAIVLLVYQFARMLADSNVVGFAFGTIAAVSPSIWQFILKTRPELLSALLGFASMFFMFRAGRAGGYRAHLTFLLAASVLLPLSILTKLNAIPFLALTPLALLFDQDTPVDRLTAKDARRTLFVLLAANFLWVVPVMFLLLRPGIVASLHLLGDKAFSVFLKSAWTRAFLIFLVFYPFFVSAARRVLQTRGRFSMTDAKRTAVHGAIYLLLSAIGWQLAIGLGFLHPQLSPQSIVSSVLPDLSKTVFLIFSPATNFQYLANGNLTGASLANVVAEVINYYLPARLLEVVIVGITWIAFRKNYRREVIVAILLLASSVLMATVSSFRGLPDRYLLYEEIPRLLAAAICIGLVIKHALTMNVRAFRLKLAFFMFLSAAYLVLALSMRVPSLGSIQDGVGCPSIAGMAADGGCICNPHYAQNTGFRVLIEQHYGAVCEEAVAERARQGLK